MEAMMLAVTNRWEMRRRERFLEPRRLVHFWWLCSFLGLVCGGQAEAPSQTLHLTFPKTQTAEVRVTGDRTRVLVPVAATEVKLGEVTFEKHFVSCAAPGGTVPFRSIHIAPRASAVSATGDWGMIDIDIDTHKLRVNGACEVEVVAQALVAGPAKSPTAETATFSLTLNFPAAQLAPLTTPVWEQVLWLPGKRKDVTGQALLLGESSGKAGLAEARLTQTDLVTPENQPATGEVIFAIPHALPPGGSMRVPFLFHGHFPLGTSRGMGRIAASELAAPVPFAFEVHCRLTRWLIIVPLLAGLGAGYLLRILLPGNIENTEAGLKLRVFEGKLKILSEQNPDSTYVASVTEIMTRLRGLRLRDTQEITEALTEAKSDLDAATKVLAAARSRWEGCDDEVRNLLAFRWQVPPVFEAAINEAYAKTTEARTLASTKNYTQATRAMEGFLRIFAARLGDSFHPWQEEIAIILGDLTKETLPLPIEIVENLNTNAKAQLAVVRNLKPPGPASTAADLRASLEGMDGVNRRFQAFEAILSNYLKPTLKKLLFLQQLPKGMKGQSLIGTAGEVTRDLNELKRRAGKLDEDASTSVGRVFEVLHSAWSEALKGAADGLTKTNRAKLMTLLKKYDYAGAANVIATELQSKVLKLTKPSAERGDTEKWEIVPKDRYSNPLLFPYRSQSSVVTREDVVDATYEVVKVEGEGDVHVTHVYESMQFKKVKVDFTLPDRQTLEKRLKRAKIMQSGLSGTLAGLFGYLIFAPGFVGTPSDFASIFAWAFTVDLSVSSILLLAGGVKKPG